MKPHIIFIIASILTISCSQQDAYDLILPNSMNLETKSINYSNNTYTVSSEDALRFIKTTFTNKTIKDTYSICEEKDTLISIINFDEGWVALSMDKRVQPILCFDESGQLTIEDINNHDGLRTWFNLHKDGIHELRNNSLNPENTNPSFWSRLIGQSSPMPNTKAEGDEPVWAVFIDNTELSSVETNVIVPHLLSTKWGNWSPWNYKCPKDYDNSGTLKRCPTGCTGVAMAQTLYYLHYYLGIPSGLYHNVTCSGDCVPSYSFNLSRSNYVSNSSRWDSMMIINGWSGNSDYVGDLIMDVSDRVGIHYSYSGSGGFPSIAGFNYFGITCNTGSYSTNTVKNNLMAGKPVLIYANTVGNTSAHTWVIDGLTEFVYHYTNYCHLEYTSDFEDAYIIYVDNDIETYFDEYYDGMEFEDYYDINYDGILMNWGHSGSYDNANYLITSPWVSDTGSIYSGNKHIFYNFRAL